MFSTDIGESELLELCDEIAGQNVRSAIEYHLRTAKSDDAEVQQKLSELCRGAVIIKEARAAKARCRNPAYVFLKSVACVYSAVNFALPISADLAAGSFLKYQSFFHCLITGLDDNGSSNNTKEILSALPFVLVLGCQSFLVSAFFGGLASVLYFLSVITSGILTLRLINIDRHGDDAGWVERLQTSELPFLLKNYQKTKATH